MPVVFLRHLVVALVILTVCFLSFGLVFPLPSSARNVFHGLKKPQPRFSWSKIPQRYPVDSIRPLPTSSPRDVPQIQFDFPPESSAERSERESRLRAVKDSFIHSWQGYKKHAWLQDEVGPITGNSNNGFGGWGATLVDSLDTLWIMGMRADFAEAVEALDYIDFSECPNQRISVFETNIRYLGGLISAYDLSGAKYEKILKKAIEVGDMLLMAFDTPNRMPITQWYWERVTQGQAQVAPTTVLLAEYGSMSLEFTRLSQITGDSKYYDAISRLTDVFESEQNRTNVPGLWPVSLKAKSKNFAADTHFTFGSMADSTYEYLPKQWLLLNGRVDAYEKMYTAALSAGKERLFYRPITPSKADILFSGSVKGWTRENMQPDSETSHLTCFVGGMVALGAKIFGQAADMRLARQLTEGCIWAYESMPSGIMPEQFTPQRCESGIVSNSPSDRGSATVDAACAWSEEKWWETLMHQDHIKSHASLTLEQRARQVILHKKLSPGYTKIADRRYLLRPEAIESVFVLYRTTGDRSLMDKGWQMFEAIQKHTRTEIAHAAIKDVSVQQVALEDKMESFWTGETLKYFYLLFSEPDIVSLDTYVLNTEAHPLRWAGQ